MNIKKLLSLFSTFLISLTIESSDTKNIIIQDFIKNMKPKKLIYTQEAVEKFDSFS